MVKNIFGIGVIMLMLAACAVPPEKIEPIDMGNAYASLDCANATNQLSHERAMLAMYEGQQNGAVAGDTVGVILLGIPTSSLTGGDVSGDVAAAKGKVIALERRVASC